MTEGELSSQDADGEKKSNTSDASSGPRLGGRFRAPSSSKVDGPAYIPDDDDEQINQVAKRFRSGPKLGGSALDSEVSLDEQKLDDQEIDGDSLLAALDAPAPKKRAPSGMVKGATGATGAEFQPAKTVGEPEQEAPNTEMDEIPMVSIEPLSEAVDKVDAAPETRATVCPSCHAENPEGMRFCVECGGSLKAPQSSDAGASVEGEPSNMHTQRRPEPPPATEAAQQENPWDVDLVCINEDGSDGKAISLKYLETTMGREGDERFPTDAFLSPKHARFHIEDGQLYVEDLYSLNGTFIKLREETRLTPGDTILMGRQVLRFERFEQSITPKTKSSDGTRYMGSPAPGGNFKVLQVGIGGLIQNVYCLPEAGAVLGREKGDIVFPHDKFMSGRHAQIYTGDDGHCYLVDLNSSNGTWIKIWEKVALDDKDYMFMGQQLFRVNYGG